MFGVRDARTLHGAFWLMHMDSSSVRGTEPQSRTFTLTVLNADDDGAASVVIVRNV